MGYWFSVERLRRRYENKSKSMPPSFRYFDSLVLTFFRACASLSEQLRRLAPLSAERTSLHQTIDHLARINAATEQDLQDLVDQNAELAGHSNQNQKIKHVASLREELVESKRVSRKNDSTPFSLSTQTLMNHVVVSRNTSQRYPS